MNKKYQHKVEITSSCLTSFFPVWVISRSNCINLGKNYNFSWNNLRSCREGELLVAKNFRNWKHRVNWNFRFRLHLWINLGKISRKGILVLLILLKISNRKMGWEGLALKMDLWLFCIVKYIHLKKLLKILVKVQSRLKDWLKEYLFEKNSSKLKK